MSPAIKPLVDFLIIAPLKEERDAVLAHLESARRLPPDEQDIRVYYQADVVTQFAGGTTGSYRVIVTSPLDMGRVEAATATADAVRRWQPRYLLLVGIAGGDPDEVELGDVLIAEQFVDYELAKRTDEDAQPQSEKCFADPSHQALQNAVRRFNERTRYQTFRADPRLYSAAQHLVGWDATVRVARPDPGKPRMLTGVVISGDKVQATTDALKPYKADWPKLIGVEMEVAGVAAAAWEAASKPGVLMVRGVSDLADAKKDSARVKLWRSYACDVAAAFTVSFLQDGPVPLRPVEQTTAPHQAPKHPAPLEPTTAPSTQIQGAGNIVGIGAIGGTGHQIHVTVNQRTSAGGLAAEPQPLRTKLGPQPTTASLRRVLLQELRTYSDLDAFCLDYFPQVKRLFSAGLDTEPKRSLLLEKEDSENIWKRLQTTEPGACRRYAHLIEIEG